MVKNKRKNQKKSPQRKRIVSAVLIGLFVLVSGSIFYVNANFNKLISARIFKLYNQSEAAKYYSLHFNKLRVNMLRMSVRVYGVHFSPLQNDHPEFFKENGSVEIEIGKIVLKNADIFDFISSNNIIIDAFKIKDSKIRIYKTGNKFQPFAFIKHKNEQNLLKINIVVQQININKAELIYYKNNTTTAENHFHGFNLALSELSFIKEQSFSFSFKKLTASIHDISYRESSGAYLSMKQFQFWMSNFQSQNKDDKFNYKFNDLGLQLTQAQFITADSIYTISARHIIIDKSKKQLHINQFYVHPNLSERSFTQRFKFQKLRSEVKIRSMLLSNIDINRLINNQSIYADSLIISEAKVKLSKSKRKPIDKRRFPHYLALQIKSIKIPLNIKVVQARNIDIVFNLEQEDGQKSLIHLNKIRGELHNVQNQRNSKPLTLNVQGNLEYKIPFSVQLIFSYARDQFSYSAEIFKSNLKSINKMIHSFAPIQIKSGTLHKIKVKGIARKGSSRGRMTFTYHNLNIQFENNQLTKNKLGNYLLSLVTNTYILSSNPIDTNLPAREVHFFAKRDRNKGFIHILVLSLLDGIKETVAPSRENRHRYKEEKKSIRLKSRH